MNLYFLLSSVILYGFVLILQEANAEEGIRFKRLADDEVCRDDMYTLDENYVGGRKLRNGEVLDCFGLGHKFASLLDWFLSKDANGTWALKVKFYASSRSNPDRVMMKHGEHFSLDNVDFDITRRTIFIVHGFMSGGDEKWIQDMTQAFLKWDDVNVFVVDWSDGGNTWNYYKAAVNTRIVGDQIATFIGQLVDSANLMNEVDYNKMGSLYFIGHSLGSHICGYASKEMKRRETKWTVQRITGLDPAQPCFKNSPKELRLDKNDAALVDIIHTNGRMLKKLGLGMPYPLGHIDFYPNGGKVQPGCILSQQSVWNYLPIPVKKISQTICSHGRSYLYFIDSLISAVKDSCTFWAFEWDFTFNNVETFLTEKCTERKCIEMGINAEKYSDNGTFFTLTGRSRPYCHIDVTSKQEVRNIIERIKKKIDCEIGIDGANETLVVYA